MNIKAVLFDLDFTLVDASLGIEMCVNYALDKMGYENASYESIKKTIGYSLPETFTLLTNITSNNEAEKFEKYFLSHVKQNLTKHTELLPQVELVLDSLISKGVMLGIVTSKYREAVDELIQEKSLDCYFDVIVCGDEVKNTKPSPDSLEFALEKIGLQKDQVIYVGDSEIDAKAAKLANIKFVGVTTGNSTHNDLSKYENLAIVPNLLGIINFIQDNKKKAKFNIIDLQSKVNEHVISLGGYWKPEFALARLFEELGELSSITDFDYFHSDLALELADIFIISTCIANQYSSNLFKSYREINLSISDINLSEYKYEVHFRNLISISGEISRLINCYEGPKKLKPDEQISNIEQLVAKLHEQIFMISSLFNINLTDNVLAKLKISAERDKGRFDVSFDPSCGISLNLFKRIQHKSCCPYSNISKLWGSPKWNLKNDILNNINELIPSLNRFVKVSANEQLDGYVITAPGVYGDSVDMLAEFTRIVLTKLSELDPAEAMSMQETIDSPEWQFSFGGQRLFIITFAPCYPENHSRYSYGSDNVFILLQPEFSFNNQNIPRGSSPKKIRDAVRKNFNRENQDYYNELIIDNNLEAPRYVKPISNYDEPIKWWVKNENINLVE